MTQHIELQKWPESLSIADLPSELLSKSDNSDLRDALNQCAVLNANLQQMKAHARALRTAIQQVAQPAEVTDEQIAACVKRASTYGLPFVGLLNPGGTPSDFSKRFTAEILALRPVQVPMTREQAMAIVQSNPDTMTAIRMTEAHHGITAQAKKETP